jgi:hypothetical protein
MLEKIDNPSFFIIITIIFLILFILYELYDNFVIDRGYNLSLKCIDNFCTRVLKDNSQDTLYLLYNLYNKLITVLPKNDIRTHKLIKRFNIDTGIFEVDPFNNKDYTSYTLNKNRIGMCLREKNETQKIHNYDLLAFVFLHELSHVLTDSYDHTPEFWNNFRWILSIAYSNNLTKIINFSENPQLYCGLNIDSNPFINI